jgi:hypothetical protein
MDWYSYEEQYKDKNGEEQTRTRYKYFDHELSKKQMEKGGYTHLGKTYTEGNTYYSLFGHKKDLQTFEGQIYQKIDAALISYAHYEEQYHKPYEPFAEISIKGTTDFTISIKGDRFNYERGYGIYNNFDGKDALKGAVLYRFEGMYDIISKKKVPFQWNGFGVGKATKTGEWLTITNYTHNTKYMGSHIIDVLYEPAQAEIMRAKYFKLFPNASIQQK